MADREELIDDEPLDAGLMGDVIEVTEDGEEVPREGVDFFKLVADISGSDKG